MKLPARLALVASTGTLLVAGLTVGTGFASTVRDSGADSVQSINRTTSMLSLEPSRQINLVGSLGSQGNDIQSNGNLGEDQFVMGRLGGQVADRTENIQSWLRATMYDSGDIAQAQEVSDTVVAEPVVAEPVVPEPVVPEPVVPEPVVPEPVVAEPVVAEPVVPEPVVPVLEVECTEKGEHHSGMHKGKDRSHGRDLGEDQRLRPSRGGDTRIDTETTALNDEEPSRMHNGKDRSGGRTRGEDQSIRPNRGGDTQIDSDTTAI